MKKVNPCMRMRMSFPDVRGGAPRRSAERSGVQDVQIDGKVMVVARGRRREQFRRWDQNCPSSNARLITGSKGI